MMLTILMDDLNGMLDVAVDEFLTFSTKYKDATMAYKVKHFENREHFRHFTATLVNSIFKNIMNFSFLDCCCE